VSAGGAAQVSIVWVKQADAGLTSQAPWVARGPCLWADGIGPRSAGLTWACSDLSGTNGAHPSASGQKKVAALLLDFIRTDPTAREWFLKQRHAGGAAAAARALVPAVDQSRVSPDAPSMSDPIRLTASKWRSAVNRVAPARAALAATQMSLVGIGVPAWRRATRISA